MRLQGEYRVDWVVLRRPGVQGLECPYSNAALFVCRLEGQHQPEGTK